MSTEPGKILSLCWKEGARRHQECVACVSLAAEKRALGRGCWGGHAQHGGTQAFSECLCNQSHPSLRCWRVPDWVLLLAGRWCHGACHEASQGIPAEDGWARAWEGWLGGQEEVALCLHPGLPGGPCSSQRPPVQPSWGTGFVLCKLSSQHGGWLFTLKYVNVLNLQ